MLDLSFLNTHINELHNQIDTNDVYIDEPGHGLEKEVHITVKYGIHEQQPYNFIPKIKLNPVKFTLTGLSLFENEKFDVLKFDVKSKDLHTLNKYICDNFECTDSYPKYHPHCTVGYLKPGTGKKYIKMKCDIIGKEMESSRFIFSNAMSDKVFLNV